MIFYLATERFSSTVRHFLKRNRNELRGVLALLTYEELFFEGAGPIGHYIFTDFDRLSRYELENAAAFADALLAAAPEARILNHPLKTLERYPLLVALHRAGINGFVATRIECGERPPRYPVFIRAEDGYGGPETDLLNNDEEFDAALADLTRRGLPRRGRIAVGYANKRAADGYFHKYGAFNIGGRIVPHDRMYGQNWVVKIRFEETPWADGRDATYGDSESGTATELNYIVDNPHRDILARAFAVARIDYGRADYGVVDGHVQIYEINTNPHLPVRTDADPRARRRAIVRRGILDALTAIDTPIGVSGRVAFNGSRPRAHSLHLPRRRMPISLARKASDLLLRRQPRRRSPSHGAFSGVVDAGDIEP
jgi:hypothetical protein